MSEKPAKRKDVASLDVETNLQTTEGRIFLNHLNTASRVLLVKGSTVEFKGEEILKTGYVGDFKSIILYKCPKGYFLFGDRAFGNDNLSMVGATVEELLSKIEDKEIKERISEAHLNAAEAA